MGDRVCFWDTVRSICGFIQRSARIYRYWSVVISSLLFLVIHFGYAGKIWQQLVTLIAVVCFILALISYIIDHARLILGCLFVLIAVLLVFTVILPLWNDDEDCGLLNERNIIHVGHTIQLSKPPFSESIPHGYECSTDGPLPYINNRDYLESLHYYVYSFPSLSGLIVYGPKSAGKSHGIREMVSIWEKEGRVIIDFDFKKFRGGYDTFQKEFSTLVTRKLSGVPFTANEIRRCFSCTRESDMEEDLPLYSADSFLTSILGKLSNFPLTLPVIQQNNRKWNAKIDVLVKFLNSNVDSVTGIPDFEVLMKVLEILALQRPSIAPIVIFRELQRLKEVDKGDIYVHNIIRYISARKSSPSIIPIIIETSDNLWMKESVFIQQKESFDVVAVTQLEKESSKGLLVTAGKCFSEDEFERLWNATGGHAGSIASIWRRRRSITESIDAIQRQTSGYISSSLSRAPSGAIDILCNLQNKDWKLIIEVTDFGSAAEEYLLSESILFAVRDEKLNIFPQNEMIRVAIERYLAGKCQASGFTLD